MNAPILNECQYVADEVRVTGDLHGKITQLVNLPESFKQSSDNVLIVLGDAGFNYYLDKRDYRFKKYITDTYKFKVYCVRGNHEARPQSIKSIQRAYDSTVDGYIYYDPEFPNIRYFEDFGIYQIQKYRVLVVGGAYSVDKPYRLLMRWRWFEDEMLSEEEQKQVIELANKQHFDFVLTHTCPLSWEPTDLFLSCINQQEVDTTMEEFFEKLLKNITFDQWLFGHFHDDRIVREGVQMFYWTNDTLDNIANRWIAYHCGDTSFLNGIKLDPKFEVVKK